MTSVPCDLNIRRRVPRTSSLRPVILGHIGRTVLSNSTSNRRTYSLVGCTVEAKLISSSIYPSAKPFSLVLLSKRESSPPAKKTTLVALRTLPIALSIIEEHLRVSTRRHPAGRFS